MKKKYIIIILLITFLVLFDQIAKVLVLSKFNIGESMIIIDNFLEFLYVRNTGAAFGLLSGNIILFIIITLFLLYYLLKEIKKKDLSKLSILSYILIISGALGNLIDRIFRGYVVDYISFTLFNSEMPVFNFADICITFGVIIFIYNIIKETNNERISSNIRK